MHCSLDTERLELLALRQEKQELAKEQECCRIAEENFSAAGEVFYQAFNAYMALYYRHGWRGGHYRNDVKP